MAIECMPDEMEERHTSPTDVLQTGRQQDTCQSADHRRALLHARARDALSLIH